MVGLTQPLKTLVGQKPLRPPRLAGESATPGM
jgi:hypothetical protein